ncbi:hypothetical protein BGZ94_001286, partial [Podila epigama]
FSTPMFNLIATRTQANVAQLARTGANRGALRTIIMSEWQPVTRAMSTQMGAPFRAKPVKQSVKLMTGHGMTTRAMTTTGATAMTALKSRFGSLPLLGQSAWSKQHQPFSSYFVQSRATMRHRLQQLHSNPRRTMSSRSSSGNTTRFSENFSLSNGNKLVYTIVAINVSVFATWQYAEANAQRFRDGRLYYFMFRNFTDSAQNLREGRIWTLVTSAFSHKDWYHILLNTMVWRLLGTRRFLTVYLGSAVASSLSSIMYFSHLEPYLRRMQHKPPKPNAIHYSLGASGSIMGLTTAFACVYPMSQYSLFFVINMPAAALIGLFGAYELYNVIAVNTGRFDSAGHLGGGLFGAAYYFTRLRPILRSMGRF